MISLHAGTDVNCLRPCVPEKTQGAILARQGTSPYIKLTHTSLNRGWPAGRKAAHGRGSTGAPARNGHASGKTRVRLTCSTSAGRETGFYACRASAQPGGALGGCHAGQLAPQNWRWPATSLEIQFASASSACSFSGASWGNISHQATEGGFPPPRAVYPPKMNNSAAKGRLSM